MEDERYYQMMVDDLERLERVHHHVSHPPAASHAQPLSEHELLDGMHQQQQSIQTPFISGLRVAIKGAVRAGVERL
ncbi:hypothetical protein QBC42DRAFT_156787, partial [Cladorrhinum samala]